MPTSIELIQDGEYLEYDVGDVNNPTRVVKAIGSVSGVSSVQPGEIFVTSGSLGWAAPDGSGGYEARQVQATALENTSFSGSSGTGTSELAAEQSSEKLKFRSADGTNHKLQGDLREAKQPSITSLSNATSGTRIQTAAEVKKFLPQTVKIYVWRDTTDVGYTSVQPPGQKWTLIHTGAGDYVDTGAIDGQEHAYEVTNEVTDVDGTTLFGRSDEKLHTYDADANQAPPSGTPQGLSLTADGTDDPPYDFIGQWSDPTTDAEGYNVDARLEESQDGSTGWTEVRGGSRTGPEIPETTFGEWEGAKNFYFYRFRARYTNSAGEGPFSSYSNVDQYVDGVGVGG